MLHWIKFIAAFLQPPGLNILVLLLALFFLLKSSNWKAGLLFLIGGGSLYGFSIPVVADYMISSLERQYSTIGDLEEFTAKNNSPQAIVALSSGVEAHDSLHLVQQVAQLFNLTKLPILVGGNNDGSTDPNQETAQVAKTLVTDFNVGGAVWVERDSHTTRESIALAKEILEQNNIKKIFLITKAWHMEQAVKEFTQQGIEVTEVPMLTKLHKYTEKDKIIKFTPNATDLLRSKVFFYTHLDPATSFIVDLIKAK